MTKHKPIMSLRECMEAEEKPGSPKLPVDNIVINNEERISLKEYSLLGKPIVFYDKKEVDKLLETNVSKPVEKLNKKLDSLIDNLIYKNTNYVLKSDNTGIVIELNTIICDLQNFKKGLRGL